MSDTIRMQGYLIVNHKGVLFRSKDESRYWYENPTLLKQTSGRTFIVFDKPKPNKRIAPGVTKLTLPFALGRSQWEGNVVMWDKIKTFAIELPPDLVPLPEQPDLDYGLEKSVTDGVPEKAAPEQVSVPVSKPILIGTATCLGDNISKLISVTIDTLNDNQVELVVYLNGYEEFLNWNTYVRISNIVDDEFKIILVNTRKKKMPGFYRFRKRNGNRFPVAKMPRFLSVLDKEPFDLAKFATCEKLLYAKVIRAIAGETIWQDEEYYKR